MVMSADHVNHRYDGDEEENNYQDIDVDHDQDDHAKLETVIIVILEMQRSLNFWDHINHNKPFAHFQGSRESSKSGIGVDDINDMTMHGARL